MVGKRASKNNKIGITRYQLYRRVFGRISESLEDGFYLEAIALEESILCDRMESIVGRDSTIKKSFVNLGYFIDKSSKQGTMACIPAELFDTLKKWWIERSKCLHAMAKFIEPKENLWEEKMAMAKTCAETGNRLVKQIKLISAKKSNKVNKRSSMV